MSSAPKRQPHGQRIHSSGGYRVYVPEPLPPRIEWSAGLAPALECGLPEHGPDACAGDFCSTGMADS
jgi:hypothetical protein